ncbi:MAG TPA: pyruvate, phosphate dikinase, partial [Deinococcales bacterium]|nr:pyruvate, phosphate dikinase [Deinococcales bacterium]
MSYVMFFDQGRGDMKDLLGGKGANLAEMTRLGLPVPHGFTITTEACRIYSKTNEVPAGMWDEVAANLARLEKETGMVLGDPQNPLLVSVRSGAKFSMPGMMDTILNLGMNDRTVLRIAEITDNERFAWDSYRRFIQMYGDVVMNVEKHKFEAALQAVKTAKGYAADIDMTADDWKALIPTYKAIYKEGTGEDFPQDAQVQLKNSILAVFQSWNNKRAKTYRALNKISDELGTACNVQMMVFGNMGMDSGTGVGFTRNPATGNVEPFGEFLLNAQGEDVVAGVRTPEPIAALEQQAPEVYHQLMRLTKDLETRLKDMQDFEFTVQRGKLYMLQTRNGKRTAAAAVKIATDLVREGLITKDEALGRVEPYSLDQLLHPHVKPGHGVEPVAKGLPASPGAATGEVVFTADEAAEIGAERAVILVTPETTPEDIHGLAAARGILTARGGMTSHAAVVARGMGKPSVVGAEAVVVNKQDGTFTANGQTVRRGEIITIDGASGLVFRGELPMEEPEVSGGLEELLTWADERKRMKVHANADTPEDAQRAREFGATGVGLCRTEHMFFNEERLGWVRKMIMSDSAADEKEALEHLLPMQRGDFHGILEAMDGLP